MFFETILHSFANGRLVGYCRFLPYRLGRAVRRGTRPPRISSFKKIQHTETKPEQTGTASARPPSTQLHLFCCHVQHHKFASFRAFAAPPLRVVAAKPSSVAECLPVGRHSARLGLTPRFARHAARRLAPRVSARFAHKKKRPFGRFFSLTSYVQLQHSSSPEQLITAPGSINLRKEHSYCQNSSEFLCYFRKQIKQS